MQSENSEPGRHAGNSLAAATVAAQAKTFTSEMAVKLTDDVLQLFGATGYSCNRPTSEL
jgi:alkylation response protein AidB-like acyl-CoA dehydrogenase